MSGKGSKPRPYSVSQQVYADNWDNIFKKDKPKKEKKVNSLSSNPRGKT